MTTIDFLTPSVESTNALRARIARMGGKATTTKLAECLGLDRDALKARLEADPMFFYHKSVWHVARFAPVGTVVFCRYWGFVYRVLEHNDGQFGGGGVTIELLDHPRTGNAYRNVDPGYVGGKCIGSVWSHSTALDPRDEILELPTGAHRATAT
jgi:hypothetical protein